MIKGLGLLVTVLVVLTGCRPPAQEHIAPGWRCDVYKNGQKVEVIKNEPGTVTNLAPPPRAGEKVEPPQKTYLTSTVLEFLAQDELDKLRSQAKDFDGYVALLRKNGYEVRPRPGTP